MEIGKKFEIWEILENLGKKLKFGNKFGNLEKKNWKFGKNLEIWQKLEIWRKKKLEIWKKFGNLKKNWKFENNFGNLKKNLEF